MKFYNNDYISDKVFEMIKREEFKDVKDALSNNLMFASAQLPEEVFVPLWEAREKFNEAYKAFLKAYSHRKQAE